MSLEYLTRRGERLLRHEEIAEYALVPAAPSELLTGAFRDAYFLAAFWTLRHGRLCAIAFVTEKLWMQQASSDDVNYLLSLPQWPIECSRGRQPARYVGPDDLSPFVPQSDDEWLLFVPDPPTTDIPSWPKMITHLDGVLVTRRSDLMIVQTADTKMMDLLDSLPEEGDRQVRSSSDPPGACP